VSNAEDYSYLSSRLTPFTESIFGAMSQLATSLGAINLGQGFPDEDGPEVIRQSAIRAIEEGRGNQYPPIHGIRPLREAIAEHQHRFYGHTIDPETDVVVGTGASEVIQATLLALIEPGAEVIMADPVFDLYPVGVSLAQGVTVAVPVTPHTLRPDLDAIEAAITPRTTMVLLNSPNNPTGIVWNSEELKHLAEIVEKYDLLVLADEAYEHLWFDGHPHHPFATLPGMAERTVTVGSAGKTFSLTGWKVGWATGPKHLISAVRVARQHLSYVSSGPFQWAIAEALTLPDEYFHDFRLSLHTRAQRLSAGLDRLSLPTVKSEGGYFVTSDVSEWGFESGEEFCQWLPHHAGVVAIPYGALMSRPTTSPYVRWAFCKSTATIDEALNRLESARGSRPG
jgi:N-succinyldiaminopimelate aminotransferase